MNFNRVNKSKIRKIKNWMMKSMWINKNNNFNNKSSRVNR